jgi:hypothetical protein
MKQPQQCRAEVVPGGAARSRPPARGPHITFIEIRTAVECTTIFSVLEIGETSMATNFRPGSLDDDIYLGLWINRSINTIRGATLTLDRTQGGLLIAFLALFVSTSGRSLWKVARTALHFAHSLQGSSEAVNIQRQAILRNTPLPLDAAYDLVLVSYAWRNRGANLLRKLLLPTTVAALLAVSFIFAGVLHDVL